jgi:hypothetical protein
MYNSGVNFRPYTGILVACRPEILHLDIAEVVVLLAEAGPGRRLPEDSMASSLEIRGRLKVGLFTQSNRLCRTTKFSQIHRINPIFCCMTLSNVVSNKS